MPRLVFRTAAEREAAEVARADCNDPNPNCADCECYGEPCHPGVGDCAIIDYDPGPCRFINVYHCQLAYGGPEEGGWHYQVRELVDVRVCPSQESAEALAADLRQGDYSNKGRRPMHSVLSQGEYSVEISDRVGEWLTPQSKPCYE